MDLLWCFMDITDTDPQEEKKKTLKTSFTEPRNQLDCHNLRLWYIQNTQHHLRHTIRKNLWRNKEIMQVKCQGLHCAALRQEKRKHTCQPLHSSASGKLHLFEYYNENVLEGGKNPSVYEVCRAPWTVNPYPSTDEYVTPKRQKTSRLANRVTFFVNVLMFQCSGVSVLVTNDKIWDICRVFLDLSHYIFNITPK